MREDTAQKCCEQGLKIFWNLDLGLFNQLKSPLSNQMQFLSLILSLEHFRDTLWKKFKDHTVGVCLYKGTANYSQELIWDDQLTQNYLTWDMAFIKDNCEISETYLKSLFARDAVAEYLTLMANRMPDAMQIFIVLNMDFSLNLMLEAQLTHRERFARFHLIVNNGRLPNTSMRDKKVNKGVCLPDYHLIDPKYYRGLDVAVKDLLNRKLSFKVIPEAFLTHEWDGLDYLLVEPQGISAIGMRKLQGFCAAGGTVVTLGNHLNLTHEVHYSEWRY